MDAGDQSCALPATHAGRQVGAFAARYCRAGVHLRSLYSRHMGATALLIPWALPCVSFGELPELPRVLVIFVSSGEFS